MSNCSNMNHKKCVSKVTSQVFKLEINLVSKAFNWQLGIILK